MSAPTLDRAGTVTRRTLITSDANDRLKAVRRLARKRSSSSFLLEGHRQLRRALEAEAAIEEVYAAPDLFLGTTDDELVTLAERRGARVVSLGAGAFRSISTATRPDGVLAVARRWPTTLESVALDDRPLLLVAEGIERPGNLGTLVRSACSSGATGLLACDGRTGVFHPDAVRGSVGTPLPPTGRRVHEPRCRAVAPRTWREHRRRDAGGRASVLGRPAVRARGRRRRQRAPRRLGRLARRRGRARLDPHARGVGQPQRRRRRGHRPVRGGATAPNGG